MNLRRQLHSGLVLLLFRLVELSVQVNTSALNDSNPRISGNMVFGIESVQAHIEPNDQAQPAYRPPQVPIEVEGYPITPDGLELEQVHIYVRHGERTPVGVRLSQPPALIPEHWMMCKTARKFQVAVFGTSGNHEFLHTEKMVERVDGTVSDSECLLGELTDIGRQSTFHFGRGLRKLYVERLHFLSDFLGNKDEVYFRSTNMPRTIESLQQIIHGLYPISKCESNTCPTVLIRNGKDENLLGNTYACKRLELLQVAFAKAAATTYNPSLARLDDKLSKYIQGNPVRVDGKPRASGIMDTVRAAIAHGIKVPAEFQDKAIVDTIERAVVNEWFAGYKTQEVRRLGMGRLLEDLTRKMQRKVDLGDRDPLKILVHSTHDTALAALCASLDVFDDQWPAFTAAITFELFRKTDNQGTSPAKFSPFRKAPAPEHYVRMRYQNENMTLPICADEGKHLSGSPEFCTLTAFRERVKELTPLDWDSECSPAGRSS